MPVNAFDVNQLTVELLMSKVHHSVYLLFIYLFIENARWQHSHTMQT